MKNNLSYLLLGSCLAGLALAVPLFDDIDEVEDDLDKRASSFEQDFYARLGDFSGEAKRKRGVNLDESAEGDLHFVDDFSGEAKRSNRHDEDSMEHEHHAVADFSGEAKKKRSGYRDDSAEGEHQRHGHFVDDFSGEAKRSAPMMKRLTAQALMDSLRAFKHEESRPHRHQ